jgi:arylformamidase
MTYYDVSMAIKPDIQVYKNKPEKRPVFIEAATHDVAGVYETLIHLNLHTGTHMDFSLHMKKDGKTSTNFDFTRLIRDVKVFDLTHVKDGITKDDLIDFDINPGDFVLLKTRNSYEDTFNFEFIFLAESGSTFLKDKKVVGVGIDALGVERNQKGYPTHNTLFDHDIIIIEGLRLKDVKEGNYHMIALPIKIEAVEALPLRVVLYDVRKNPISNNQ